MACRLRREMNGNDYVAIWNSIPMLSMIEIRSFRLNLSKML